MVHSERSSGRRAVRGLARLAVMTALLGGGCGAEPRAAGGAAEPPASFRDFAEPPPPAGVREGRVRVLRSRADSSLVGPHAEGAPGDLLLEHGELRAVVSREDGKLVDLGEAGTADDLGRVTPLVADGLAALDPDEILVAPDGPSAILVMRRFASPRVLLSTWFYFSEGTLRMESVASTAGEAASALTLGEHFGWGNTPTWVAGHGFVEEGGEHLTDLVARQSHGTAFAACKLGGELLARVSHPALPGFHASPSTGESPEAIAAEGLSRRRTIALAVARGSLGDAVMKLPCRAPGAVEVAMPEGTRPEHVLEVERCGSGEPGARPYARFALSSVRAVRIPEGCFLARLVADGHAPGRWVLSGELARSEGVLPQAGRLSVRIAGADGEPLPAAVVVRGVDGTPDPDWGDDGRGGAARSHVYSLGSADVPLPPGRYRVIVHRGPEYDDHEQTVDVEADRAVSIEAVLERVVDTTGWLSADLHLHAAPSSDAPTLLEDRVRSLVAVGVEVGVATDHNRVTDYAPTIRAMGVGAFVASIVGDEVTTERAAVGHFNVFPLPASAAPIPHRGVTPAALFAAARAASGSPWSVLQVNHPRMGSIGYFDLMRMDPTSVARWRARVPLADLGFDAIEVFNGDDYANLGGVETCLTDWYALLDAGHRFTATGNSDSHKITYQEAGTPRNWVRVEIDDPAQLDAEAFSRAVRQGKVVVSSGPFVTLEVGGRGVGDTVAPGAAEVAVTVEAPTWVGVDRVEILLRGRKIAGWSIPPGGRVTRFEVTDEMTLEEGDWVVAVARGSRPMPHLYREGATPFGFTNPVYVGKPGG